MKRVALTFLIALFSRPIVALDMLGEPAHAQTTPAAADPSTSIPAAGAAPADNLVVYRAHAEPTAFSPTIEVDGAKIVSLPNRHYTSISIGPGIHTLTIAWPRLSGQRTTEMRVDIKESEPHYFEVMGTSRVAGLGAYGGEIRERSWMAEVAPEQAQAAIASCCKYKPSTEH